VISSVFERSISETGEGDIKYQLPRVLHEKRRVIDNMSRKYFIFTLFVSDVQDLKKKWPCRSEI
jgi:hypothetical protein